MWLFKKLKELIGQEEKSAPAEPQWGQCVETILKEKVPNVLISPKEKGKKFQLHLRNKSLDLWLKKNSKSLKFLTVLFLV